MLNATKLSRDCETWIPNWLPNVELVGPTMMPRLQRIFLKSNPQRMLPFTEISADSMDLDATVHGYVRDRRLNQFAQGPNARLQALARHHSVVAPDFSVCKGMPIQERIRGVWLSRAVTAFYESRGLTSIPNIRWAELTDLEFALEGLPTKSVVSISTQGLVQDPMLRRILCEGILTVVERLEPETLILYGSQPPELFPTVETVPNLLTFPTRISQVFAKGIN